MTTHDTHDRLDLTGPWAGFGFQGGHMFTPEGHQLEPTDMVWWSLTCNIAREWRTMMDEVRPAHQRTRLTADRSTRPGGTSVIYLRDVLLRRHEKRLSGGDRGPAAEPSNVVHMRRGPMPRRRG